MLIVFALTMFVVNCGGNSNAGNQTLNAKNGTTDNSASNNINVAVATPVAVQTNEVPTFDNAEAALEAGKKFFETDEDEKAVKVLEQAVQLDPNLPAAQFQLALAYDAIDNEENADKSYNAAIKSYLKLLQKNPKDAAAQLNLGRSYNKINEDEKAFKALQQAVKLSPDDGEYHFEFGNILIKLAKYPEAIKELKKSLELDPENSRAEAALEKAESGNARVSAAQAKSKEVKLAAAKNAATNPNHSKNINASPTTGNIKNPVDANTNP